MIGATVVSLASPLLIKLAIDRGIEEHDAHAIDLIAALVTSRSSSCGRCSSA